MLLPLLAAGALAVGLFAYSMSSSAKEGSKVPELPPGPTPPDSPVADGPGAEPSPSAGAGEGPMPPTGGGGAVGPGTGNATVPKDALPPAPPAAPGSGALPTTGAPTLRLGSKGEAVKTWQQIVGVKDDGIFGPETLAATKAWQKAHGLVADGIVGPKTWLAAASPLGVIPVTGKTAGAVSTTPTGVVDDGFDALVAAAIAKGDAAALMALATQAEARGLLDIARSIRDEAARLTMGAPAPTPPGPDKPTVPSTSKPTGRAVISMAAGSRGADVIEWQKVLGIKQDGIFGKDTDSKTRAWQKTHGLVADGIVGPKSWALAYQQAPSLATAPRPAVSVVTPTGRPLLKLGSQGKDVVEWQGVIGVKQDGIFGNDTNLKTKAWQRSNGLVADGIVGPATWAKAYAAKPALTVSIGTPQRTTVPTAPISLPPMTITPTATSHATIRKGSANNDVKIWQQVLGVTADGIFGSGTDTATKKWQASHGLVADGIVGPKTWAAAGV